MSNGIVNIHGKQYVTVAKRLADAHKGAKLQGIKTEVLQFNPVIVIKATIVIDGKEYTGISSVNTGTATGNTEKSSPFEVAETSAVGRALAFAGFETELGIASAEEVEKAIDTPPVQIEEAKVSREGSVQEDKKDWCYVHNTQMKPRSNENKSWFDHRHTVDGEWETCYGKGWPSEMEGQSSEEIGRYLNA